MPEQERKTIEAPKLSPDEVKQELQRIEEALKHGDILGFPVTAGKFAENGTRLRFGLRGNIEHIMGWHPNPPSPETGLTAQDKVKLLEQYSDLAKSAGEKATKETGLADLKSWLDEEILKVSRDEVDRIVTNPDLIPEEKRGIVKPIIAEIAELQAKLTKKPEYLDTHPKGDQAYTPSMEQIRAASEVIKQINLKKMELYKLLFVPAEEPPKPGVAPEIADDSKGERS